MRVGTPSGRVRKRQVPCPDRSTRDDGGDVVVTPLAVPIAFGLDAIIGEPPRRLHPVAWFGTLVEPADRDWARPGIVGLALAVFPPLLAAAVAGLLVGTVTYATSPAGVALAGLVLFLTTSWRRLLEHARSVIETSEGDLHAARRELPALVGRDPSDLSPAQVRSAAVESAAENLADGLVAPLFAFAVVAVLAGAVGPSPALALGVATATWVKTVNTLDSMVGYPDKPHGRASARLDDVVMWVPARVTAALLALVAGQPRSLVTARAWLAGVPSPNAGWPMGAIAATAGCRLEKPGVYVLNEDAPLPDVPTAERAARSVAWAGLLAYALACLLVTLGVLAWS